MFLYAGYNVHEFSALCILIFYVCFLEVDGGVVIFCNIKVAFLGLKHLIFYFYAIKFAQQVLAYNI